MPRERIYSDERLDFGVDPEWDPKDSAEAVRIVSISEHPDARPVRVRPYVDVSWDGQGVGAGVQVKGGAFVARVEDPSWTHESSDVDLSLVGPLMASFQWRTCNNLVKVLRRARNADNGPPE
jgi:hypothetical protein